MKLFNHAIRCIHIGRTLIKKLKRNLRTYCLGSWGYSLSPVRATENRMSSFILHILQMEGLRITSPSSLITSLQLLEQINIFRKEDGKSDLRHDTLLSIIRDEFDEEIGLQKIMETPYIHPQNKQTYFMFELTISQARRVLFRESKYVRRAVSEYLDKIEEFLRSKNLVNPELYKFLDIKIQKGYSKQINARNFQEGGVTKTVGYNFRNCVLHTGKTPAQIKKIGKERGLKSKQTTSAKEVIRNLKPAVACSMSFTDKLVSEEGIEHEIAAKTAKDYATPLFEQLMKIGLSYEDVKKLS